VESVIAFSSTIQVVFKDTAGCLHKHTCNTFVFPCVCTNVASHATISSTHARIHTYTHTAYIYVARRSNSAELNHPYRFRLSCFLINAASHISHHFTHPHIHMYVCAHMYAHVHARTSSLLFFRVSLSTRHPMCQINVHICTSTNAHGTYIRTRTYCSHTCL